jgi:hypothetical protein
MTGRTAAYGRAASVRAVKRGAVQANPSADLPVAEGIAKRERILSYDENRRDLAGGWRGRIAV